MMKIHQRILFFIFLILLIVIPPMWVGFYYLHIAETILNEKTSSAYYEKSAIFLFWRDDLYEKAALLEAQDPHRAIRLLLKSRSRGSLSSLGQVYLGDAYQASKQTDLAMREWEQLFYNNQQIPLTGSRLSAIYHARADFQSEIQTLKKWLEVDPQNPEASLRMGLLLASEADPQALHYLQISANRSTQDRLRLSHLISALEETGSEDEYRLTKTAQSLAERGEWALAEKALSLAVEKNENYAAALALLGLARQQRNATGSESFIQKALHIDPNSAAIHATAGTYYLQQANPQKAQAEFFSATQLEPQNPAWWAGLASATAKSNLPGALQAYTRAVNLAPNESIYWYQLAIFCVENNVYIEDYGLKAALRAFSLDPQNPAFMDALGRAQMAAGQTQSAEIMFKKALEVTNLKDYDVPIHFHLGLLYLQTGRNDEALKEFTHTVKNDPDGPYGFQAKNLLTRYFP